MIKSLGLLIKSSLIWKLEFFHQCCWVSLSGGRTARWWLKKLIASTSASHFQCDSTHYASYFLWLILLSSSLISHSFHPTFSSESSLASVFLLLLFHLQHRSCISSSPLHFLEEIRSPESNSLQSHPLHFVNIWAMLLGCNSRSDFHWLIVQIRNTSLFT